MGNKYAHINLLYNTRKHQIECELYIRNNKDLYYKLEENKEEINSQISNKLQWKPLEGKKSSRITLKADLDVDPDSDDWNEAFEWALSEVELFNKVFKKYLK